MDKFYGLSVPQIEGVEIAVKDGRRDGRAIQYIQYKLNKRVIWTIWPTLGKEGKDCQYHVMERDFWGEKHTTWVSKSLDQITLMVAHDLENRGIMAAQAREDAETDRAKKC